MPRPPSEPSNPATSLALLWGSHSREARSGLSVRSIVSAATELADVGGFAKVSMAAVAKRLSVGTMSLYTHIPGKADLAALMIDSAHGELYGDVSEPQSQPGGWRGSLEFIARRNWELLQKHPWLLELSDGRPVLGPHTTLKYEAELRPLDHLGLTEVEMDAVLTLVLAHVGSAARAEIGRRETQASSGMNDEEWWVSNEPILAKVMDASRFPTASRVGQAAGEAHHGAIDPQYALAFGLSRILDGVEALLTSRKKP
jgi:AcrR family transcriptional regulator